MPDLHQPQQISTAPVTNTVTRFVEEAGQGVQRRCVIVVEDVVCGQHRLTGREQPRHEVCPMVQVARSNVVHRLNLTKGLLVDPRLEQPG